jgi:PilZ domain
MSPRRAVIKTIHGVRSGARAHCVREITVSREGNDEIIRIKAPDVSATGMFISTSQSFPEGTVLNLKFRLAVSGVEVRTRGEVRYCHPGIGMGVEFIGISPEARKGIERELALSGETSPPRKKSLLRSRSFRRR